MLGKKGQLAILRWRKIVKKARAIRSYRFFISCAGFLLMKTLLIIFIALSLFVGETLAVDQIDIDYGRELRSLPYNWQEISFIEPGKQSRTVTDPLRYLPEGSTLLDSALIVHVRNSPPHSNEHSSLLYTDLSMNQAYDQDPIRITINSYAFYRDHRSGFTGIILGCCRNDSAFVATVIPGSDKIDLLYLTSGSDRNGNDRWEAGVSPILVSDYDFDGRDEAFFYVNPARDLYPREVYCIEPAELEIEWVLPSASSIGEKNTFDCRDSLEPSIIFSTYNPKNGVSDSNYSDMFAYLSRVDSNGNLLLNKIISVEYSGVNLLKATNSLYYITHSLPFLNPDDTLDLPDTEHRLSLITNDGQILKSVPLDHRIRQIFLDKYQGSGEHLYCLTQEGKILIYDPGLKLMAESNATDFRNFAGKIMLPGQTDSSYMVEVNNGTAFYSMEFKKQLEIPHRYTAFENLNYRTENSEPVYLFTGSQHSSLLTMNRVGFFDRLKIVFWENRSTIIVILIGLLAMVVAANIMYARAMRRLKISEARFREMADLLPEGIYEMNLEGKITFANRTAIEKLDYSYSDLEAGLSAFQMIAPKDRQRAIDNMDNIIKGEVHTGGEYEMMRKDGSTFPAILHSSLIESNGQPRGLRGVIIDITDRKTAMDQLRESEIRYRTLFHDSPIIISEEDYSEAIAYLKKLKAGGIEDLESHLKEHIPEAERAISLIKVLNVNTAALQTYEAESTEELIRHATQASTPRSRRSSIECLCAIERGQKSHSTEFESRTVKGNKLHLYVRVTVAPGSQNNPYRVLVSIIDISERVQAEQALRQSEEKYRLLVENVPASIAMVSDQGRFLFVNEVGAKYLGVNRNETIGKTMWDLFPQEIADRQVANVCKVIKREQQDMDESQTMVQGQLRWFSTSIQPIRGPHGKFDRALIIASDVTQRKVFEEKLRRSETRLRAIINSIDDLVFVISKTGEITYFEQSADRPQLIIRPDEFLGKHISDVLPANVSKPFMSILKQIASDGKTRQLDYALKRGSVEHWYSTKISALNSPDGSFWGVTAVARDISSMVEANKLLRAERDLTRSILETANSLIICLDENANIKVFNDECERVTGYTREEVLGKNWIEMFLPQPARHEGLQDFSNWVRYHPGDKYEGPIVTKTGETRIILWSNSAIINPHTEELTAIAIGHDITDRIRTEEALKNSEAKMAAQFNSIPVPTYTWKFDGDDFILIDHNLAAEQITGGGIKRALGMKLKELYGDRPDLIEDIYTCFKTRRDIHREMKYRYLTNDSEKYLLVSYGYVPDDIVLVHTQDITDRIHVEEEKIRQARDIAGGFAHEIRNSLFPVRGALSLIEKNFGRLASSNGDLLRYIKITDSAVTRAFELTKQISQYTKMETQYFPENVDLREIMDEMLKENAITLESEGIEVEHNGFDNIRVIANGKQLYQVLNNLLLNSVDALAKSSNPLIRISAVKINGIAEIRISDNGEGIPPENLSRIFEAFYSTRPDHGTGIGLALSKKIVDMYDGDIEVKSQPGQGAEFCVKLKCSNK